MESPGFAQFPVCCGVCVYSGVENNYHTLTFLVWNILFKSTVCRGWPTKGLSLPYMGAIGAKARTLITRVLFREAAVKDKPFLCAAEGLTGKLSLRSEKSHHLAERRTE